MVAYQFPRHWAFALTVVLCSARLAFATEDALSDGPEWTEDNTAAESRWGRSQPDSTTMSILRLPSLHGLPLDIIGSHLGARDHAMLSTTDRNFAEFTRSHPRRRMIEHMRANLHNPAVVAEVVRDGTIVDLVDVLEMLQERGRREGTQGYWNRDPLLLALRYRKFTGDAHGVTPLMYAIQRGSTDVAYQLATAGAPVKILAVPAHGHPCDAARQLDSPMLYHTMSRVSCLLRSVASGDEEMVKFLLRYAPELVNVRDEFGRTVLHRAHKISMVKMLVEKFGADVNVYDSTNESPLTNAVSLNDITTVRYLLEHGADADPRFGRVPLIWSVAAHADLAITELLLTVGKANVDRRQLEDGHQMTALIQSVHDQLEDVTALLLRHGARTDIKRGPFTPVHIACMAHFAKGLDLLLAAGADPFTPSTGQLTPLHISALTENVETTRILLPYYSDGRVNVGDVFGQTALHYAALATSMDVVRALVEAGADVNAVEAQVGWTPLWCAATGPSYEIQDAPDDAEVDGLVQDLENNAQRKNRLQIVQYLVQNGGRMDVRDSDGATLVQMVHAIGRLDIARFLERIAKFGLVNLQAM